MEGVENRKAYFKTSIAFTNGEIIKTFVGVVYGNISYEAKGSNGFGYDPIFVPDGHTKTFAEDLNVKDAVSHRKRPL